MPILSRLVRQFNSLLLNMSWMGLTVLVSVHFFSSWFLLWLAGEQALVAPDLFWYFYMVTSTTVGYGDYSPVTAMGRAVVSFWLMTGGITLFAAVIGKVTQFLIELWRKRMRGRGDYGYLSDHVVILGWHDDRTPYMVEQILGDKRRDQKEIVLCSTRKMENPLPDQTHFVQGESLTGGDLLQRAGIKTASRIIIYGDSDEQTLAIGLAVSAAKTAAHIVAHFDSDEMAVLLKSHCAQAECTASISLELIVRSAQDPGSSRIQTQLLSTLSGPTQYCLQVPDSFTGCRYGTLFYVLKEQHEATAFGVAETRTGDDLELNPAKESLVLAGQYIYFMSPERIRAEEVDWQSLGQAVSGVT